MKKTQPKTAKELFDDFKDDGIRDHEIDWGMPEGNELQW